MEHQLLAAPANTTSPASQAHQQNRRRHPRYPCEGHAEVCLPSGGLLLRGKILDISLSGCFIQAPAMTLERGTSVEVYFSARQMQFRVAGNIAVLHPRKGAGIAFQRMIPRRTRQIAELVSELKQIAESGNPAQ